MTATEPDPWVSMNSRLANARAEAELGFWYPAYPAAAETGEREPDAEAGADLGRDYDGPELHPGTPEYEAEYAEYQAWAGQTEPETEPELEAGL